MGGPGEAITLEAGGRRDGEVEMEEGGSEKTELEAQVMRVRRRKAWKAKLKMEKEQELEEIRRLGKVDIIFMYKLWPGWGVGGM